MENVLEVKIEEAGYDQTEAKIRNISFALQSGQLLGLIGPNGAGKSTTIKSILGLLPAVKGEITFANDKPKFAYIPEHPILYDELTLWEHLRLAASVYEMEEKHATMRAESLLEKFKLTEVKHHLPGSFSKGMQQKVMLIIGFLNQPDVYIVDEPFIGLDPIATKDLLAMLEEEKQRGAGILMSTHVLDTAERICDKFLLLSAGSVVADGTLAEIQERSGQPGASLFDCFHQLV
ncbi:ABC transporter ATP-binding protein [Paenibacillus albiflavus]|uniref:ABC transporter ATP-binding protein n=1 Tax=Paenibacillus albiflavus TaxID=2545760 RepID=A0A4R4EAY6_9BACL|nr:ABC transporter ATP-binding protein [Paenibacillus albiflavus]TCZ77024.1 ABC transporter ATP-binding protein [Paenibacillus albiflavus]